MHWSTAAARSGRMLRMLSSALAERRLKLSQASKRIAAGEEEPGRKTESEDAIVVISFRTQMLTLTILGTFWMRSQTSEDIMRMPSGSVTANAEPV